jgi:hypothetical protein
MDSALQSLLARPEATAISSTQLPFHLNRMHPLPSDASPQRAIKVFGSSSSG